MNISKILHIIKNYEITDLNNFFKDIYDLYYMELSNLDTHKSISYQKKYGIFLTPYNVALHTSKNTLKLFDKNNLLKSFERNELSFFEPFCGIGTFVISFLETLDRYLDINKNKRLLRNILENVYISDIDQNNIVLTKIIVEKYLKWRFQSDCSIKDENCYVGNILYDQKYNIKNAKYIFGKEIRFDIILTNPPYRNMTAGLDKDYKNLSKKIKKQLYYQTGILNLYKISLEVLYKNYLSDKGAIGVVIPGSFLKDRTSRKLREYTLENFKIKKIYISKENSDLFKVNQHICFFGAKKEPPSKTTTDSIQIIDLLKREIGIFKKDIIERFDQNLTISPINEREYEILNQLSYAPRLKDIENVVNLRGELDLTLDKKYITDKKTSLRLIQGRHIDIWTLNESIKTSYVTKEFLNNISNKKKYIFKNRIACHQISNLNKNKRLHFSFVPKNNVLGNSCNFICTDNKENMFYLLGLLNSYLIDWFFQKFSSNNHINNYEIDEIPILFEQKQKKEIVRLVSDIIRNKSKGDDIEEEIININKIVFDIYKLNDNLCMEVLKHYHDPIAYRLINFYKKRKLYNHTLLKVSDLDMRMIRSIPEGGNWKHIPLDIPSKRLEQIRRTGGRTTLYGRLRWDAPSYTISTYFTRPGNGTFIHPNDDKYINPQHRLITPREAARLQSFPDNYRFFGSRSKIATQIGNAVPPLLAFCIALELNNHIKNKTMIDLFSGAGGMGLGFKWAGFQVIVANDNFKDACDTYRYNHPGTIVVEGDITQEVTKKRILEHIGKRKIGVIAGGPPCQGFSLAGKRLSDDPRNFLFKEFVEMVEIVQPEMFIMENVPGLLSSNGGKTYKSIIEEFSLIGYKISSQILNSAEFGVPQKRRRVFIVGARQDYNFVLPPILSDDMSFITVKDAISNLQHIYPINTDILEEYPEPETPYQEFLSGIMPPIEFINSLNKRNAMLSRSLFNFAFAAE